ncbi:MAG: hypothetical protein ABIO14_02235, partial [Aeromicrobium sp.]
RLFSLEPETVLPRLTTEAGPLIAAAVVATMNIFERAVEDGLRTPTADLTPGAEVMVRVVHSILLTPQALVPLKTYDDLIGFAHSHLVPIVSRES